MDDKHSGSLTGGQLLRSALRWIYRRYRVKPVWFKQPPLSLIANDSDWHRTRQGFMRYRTGKIISLGHGSERTYWLLARGQAYGAYPADSYDSDILAVRLDERPPEFGDELAAAMAMQVSQYSYFASSLLVTTADGLIFCPVGNIMGARLKIACEGPASGWVAQTLEINPDMFLASTLSPVVTQTVRYRPEAAAELARLIVRSLEMC